MESKEILLKPKDMYTRQLKEQYHKGATEYFEKLTKEAKTDTELNKKHVEEYNTLLEEVKKCENAVNNTKAFKIFLIVIIVICFVVGGILGLIGAFSIATLWYLLLIGVVLVGLAIYLIVHINTKIKKEQQKREQTLNETREKAQKKLDECYADMAELNSLYDWNIPATIMENVTNIIDLDPYFSVQKYNYLNEKFGLGEVSEPNCSVLGVISGNIQGNPFVLEKTLTENLVNKTYHGSLTIHWTTYSRDSKGRSVAHHHSETLHASVTKPAPDYRTQTVLIYGNEAAPHLHFRRGISKINSYKNEKEKEKAVKEGMKEINKYAEKTIKEGGSFTPIGNDEFDVFFGGLDRDNEVEFRLLFTPLAQQNMLSLLNDPEPYGDDFNMVKNGMINIIASAHSQSFDYSANPNQFQSYDYQQSQASFVNYCDQFIQNLYFDLAPLLSIPLYQMHKPHEYIYEKEWNSNYSSFEQEALANGMSKNDFIPRGANSSLPLLLKTTSSSKVGKTDKVNIHAYSYHTTEMCDYVRVHGGDGHNHDVPVHWIKYDRVDSDTEIGIRYVGSNRKDVQEKYKDGKITSILSNTGNMYYERGLLSFLNPNGITQETDNQIASLFEEIKKEVESNN
jgi:hypothetical protein